MRIKYLAAERIRQTIANSSKFKYLYFQETKLEIFIKNWNCSEKNSRNVCYFDSYSNKKYLKKVYEVKFDII